MPPSLALFGFFALWRLGDKEMKNLLKMGYTV